jgi:hypothetical protein
MAFLGWGELFAIASGETTLLPAGILTFLGASVVIFFGGILNLFHALGLASTLALAETTSRRREETGARLSR